MSAGCRIGKVTLKGGASLQLLPSARERNSAKQFGKLAKAMRHVDRLYSGQLDGFVIMCWTPEARWNAFYACGEAVNTNILPEYCAGAIRREICEDDARDLVDRVLKDL